MSSANTYLFSCERAKHVGVCISFNLAHVLGCVFIYGSVSHAMMHVQSRDRRGRYVALLNCFDHANASVRAHGLNNRNNVVRHLVVAHVLVVNIKKTFQA